MEWKIAFVLLFLSTTVMADDVVDMESSMDNLRHLLTERFSTNRHHTANPVGKETARVFLVEMFETYGLDVVLQKFPSTNGDPGENVIGTWLGRYTGTPADRPVLLGAHYDTKPTTPGVNDNGSGLSALLEAARIITSQPCKPDHTVIFAAYDFEESNMQGSAAYISDILLPYLNESGIPLGNFQGAIIMDGILNYNNSKGSQYVPQEFQMVPGSQDMYNYVADDGFRGNFVGIAGREPYDSHLYAPFLEAWGDTTQHRAVNLFVPMRDVFQEGPSSPFWPVYKEVLRSDHKSFYRAHPDLKAIQLMDTAEFRGYMQQCYHQECDNSQFVTEDNLIFLKRITDAVIKTSYTLAGGRSNCTGEDDDSAASSAPPSGGLALQAATVVVGVITAFFANVVG